MSLLAIKRHMIQVKKTSLASLCALFQSDPESMRCLLRHWIQKGCVRICPKKPDCGTKCSACPLAVSEVYEWIDVSKLPADVPLTCF